MSGIESGDAQVTCETTFALRLARLHPDRKLGPAAITRDAVALVTALEGQTDARFVLQTVGRPNPVRPEHGRIDIDLIATLGGDAAGPPRGDRVEELRDDLLDLLGAPPLRWTFEPVPDDELASVLYPLTPTYVAEIARREEPCPPSHTTSHVGFGSATLGDDLVRPIWSLWTFGQPADDMERVAAVLLAQETPVAIRASLVPTELTVEERDSLERALMEIAGILPVDTQLSASRHSLESFLHVRPLFETRCIVAGSERLSRSMLSAIGHSISEPPRSDGGRNHLAGGFAVLRGESDVDAQALRDAFERGLTGEPLPSLAPPSLARLRRVLGPWEAASVFRIPAADDDRFPGIETLRTPDLDPPISQLARTGSHLGHLLTRRGQRVLLPTDERFRHMYVSGQTGTGKSTLLLNLAVQDIVAGDGVAVIDPHGDLVEALLRRIPEERIDDVVLIDPADPEAVVGVNLLEAETAVQRSYIVSELCAMFYSLFDPNHTGIVGPRYETWLRQGAGLLLANADQPSSFLDIPTLFVDKAVTQHLIRNINDPVLAEFWLGEMPATTDFTKSEILGWFRSKFEVFRTSALVRNVVGQAKSTFSFADVLGERKILLVNLSKGLLGEYNSALIGHIVFARLWGAALERASVAYKDRPDFYVYIDEFQNSTSDSLPVVLSEARKFRIALTLANQFFTQVPEMTRDSIMGNVGSRVTLRIGPKDAQLFTAWFGKEVEADHLTGLPNYTAISSLSNDGVPIDPLVMRTEPACRDLGAGRAEEVRCRSREQWARPVGELEDDFFGRWRHIEGSIASRVARPAAPAP